MQEDGSDDESRAPKEPVPNATQGTFPTPRRATSKAAGSRGAMLGTEEHSKGFAHCPQFPGAGVGLVGGEVFHPLDF